MWSRRVSPARVLLCAAFMALAFALASWTSARADDKGLLGAVVESVPTVGQVFETTTDVVDEAAADVPAPPVAEPVAAVVAAAEEPVRVVDKTTAVARATTSKTVSRSTSGLVETVKETAPVTRAVLDPVVAVVAPVIEAVDPPTGATLPDPFPVIVEPLVPGAVPDPGEVLVPSVETVTPGRAEALPPLDPASAPASLSLPGRDHAASVGSRSPRHVEGGTGSDAPRHEPVGTWDGKTPANPALDVLGRLGAAGGPSSAGSSAPGGADPATTSASLVVPRAACAAPHSRLCSLIPGPVQDPGSRPD